MKRIALKSVKIEFDRYIHLDFQLLHLEQFHESIDSDQLLEASAIVLLRELYSYEVDVKSLS